MVKVRLMGPTNEIKRLRRIIERNRCLDVDSMSDIFSNKGTKKYFRQYVEVSFNDTEPKKNKKEK